MMAPFTARDGENIALYQWPLDRGDALESGYHPIDRPGSIRGMVLIVHGLGEHALRYSHVAARLMDWGFVVRAYDQRGHGRSGGARGMVPTETALLDDLADIVDDARMRCRRLGSSDAQQRGQRLPLVLLGHSLGGLLASRLVSLNPHAVDALVLSSPALDAGFRRWQKMMLAVLPKLAPDLVIGNGLRARDLSRDPSVVARYQADALVHSRISLRLAQFIVNAGRETLAAAAHWTTPTLLMYAGADRIVSPAGSAAFAERSAMSPHVQPATVTARCFGKHYHELFNEPEPELVFAQLGRWLDTRFKPKRLPAQ